LDILSSGKLQQAGIGRVGVAGHPEGSPDIGPEVLNEAFRQKRELSRAGEFEIYVVSQFCFDAAPIVAWERSLRLGGNQLPVHVGVPGVTSPARLIRYAAICGVRASVSFLKNRGGSLGRFLARWTPGAMVANIAAAVLRDPQSRIRNLHFFPFGGFPDTVAWINAIAEGRYAITENEGGLDIDVNEDTR
jgi:methylenetetrahydrofolate reductase (NADPH)